MKKFTALILALVMALSFAACAKTEEPAKTPSEEPEGNGSVTDIEEDEGQSEDEEGLTVIPMGGNTGCFDLVAAGITGRYVEVEVSESLNYEDCESHQYYCETGDCRYISTFRWAKDGSTLQAAAEAEREETDWVGPQYSSWEEPNFGMNIGDTGIATLYGGGSYFDDGEYYFTELILFEDGDDFVEICFSNVSEELQLGDTGEYLWIPAGYTDLNTEEFKTEYGVIAFVEYPEGYYYPHISVEQTDDDYKLEQWFREDSFPDGLPVTREQYEKWCESGWNDKSFEEYAEAFGYEDAKYAITEDKLGNRVEFIAGKVNDLYLEVTYIEINGEWFGIHTGSALDPSPRYAKAIAESIHTK